MVVMYITEAWVISPVIKTKLIMLLFVVLLKNNIKPGMIYKTKENRSNVKYSISIVCSKN